MRLYSRAQQLPSPSAPQQQIPPNHPGGQGIHLFSVSHHCSMSQNDHSSTGGAEHDSMEEDSMIIFFLVWNCELSGVKT